MLTNLYIYKFVRFHDLLIKVLIWIFRRGNIEVPSCDPKHCGEGE